MYGWFNIGNNVSGIMFNMVIFVFAIVLIVAIGLMVYAAKKLKQAEQILASKDDE